MLSMNKRKLTQKIYIELIIIKKCLINRTTLIKQNLNKKYSYIKLLKKQ